LREAGDSITFTAVAHRASIGRATLYRHHHLRRLVEFHRDHAQRAAAGDLGREIRELRDLILLVADAVLGDQEAFSRLSASVGPLREGETEDRRPERSSLS
jgi:hypothetical protein